MQRYNCCIIARFACSRDGVHSFHLKPSLDGIAAGSDYLSSVLPGPKAVRFIPVPSNVLYLSSHSPWPTGHTSDLKDFSVTYKKLFRKLQTSGRWFWHDCPKVPQIQQSNLWSFGASVFIAQHQAQGFCSIAPHIHCTLPELLTIAA